MAGGLPLARTRRLRRPINRLPLKGGKMIPAKRVPTHPGEILEEEFLKPLGISQVAIAAHLGVPVQRINELVRGKRGVTPETAWLLSQALNTTPEFWLNLQMTFDLFQNRPRREIQALRLTSKTVAGTPGRV